MKYIYSNLSTERHACVQFGCGCGCVSNNNNTRGGNNMKRIVVNPFEVDAFNHGSVVKAFTDNGSIVKVVKDIKTGKVYVAETLNTCTPYDLVVNYEKPSKNPLRLTEKETQQRLALKDNETMKVYRSSGAYVINGNTKQVMTREEQIKQGKARVIIIDNKHDTPISDSNALIQYGEECELAK